MTEMTPYLDVKDEEKCREQTDADSSDVNDWDLPMVFDKPRHLEPIQGAERVEHSWRVKEKYKTHCVALVLCLNVGVDPPDVVKTQPCARLECWIDPSSLSPSKALESIGHALQAQYERWQPRARYKHALDPTSDEVKKLCCSLRRNAKDERVLLHYNGHGVPRPTAQGEIWVFNRAYTQYIPLSMYDLQTWMGAPSLYVYDCSSAGVIVDNFMLFADQHERDYEMATARGDAPGPPVCYRNCIQLAACAAGQTLPMHPELPADLFTACLTTPVKMAMKWFVLRHRTRVAPPDVHDLIDKIPGQVTDRRTMLGELNWIFTAITDTIAWSSLPGDTFQQLFRADLLTASLCRNFLLAERIMKGYNCTPVSSPALPALCAHPLWAAWDHTLDLALAQLPALLSAQPPDYRHSPFFRDQLTAFQVWLDLGSSARPPPAQLPMVLQVLLSTLHRVRALQILCRFLALGAWAVRAVLHVGIFPYMLKLLQASAPDLRPTMVYIWAKIIAVDPSCQVDLVNAKGHKYFVSVLQDSSVDIEHRTLSAFVLCGLVDQHPCGQQAALQASGISACLEQLQHAEEGEAGARLAKWAALALGRLWRGFDAARWAGVRDLAHEKLYPLLQHRAPEVRAAAAFALGTFVACGLGAARSEHAGALEQQVLVALAERAPVDASALVRAELLNALQWAVLLFEPHFIAVYLQERRSRSDREMRRGASGSGGESVDRGLDALAAGARRPASPALSLPAIGFGSVYTRLWAALAALAREPHPAVGRMAHDIVAHVADQVDNVGREVEARTSSGSGGFASLPPSPSSRADPAAAHTLPRRPARGSSSTAVTASDEPDTASSGSSGPTSIAAKKAIVNTAFAEWCAAAVARADDNTQGGIGDCESRAAHERAWRYARNRAMRAAAEATRGGRVQRLDQQAFHSRCPLPPMAVVFHPYEQQIAVASKDNFGVWEWGSAARVSGGAWRRAWGRVCALAWLNAHSTSLLAGVGAGGALAVFRPQPGLEPALLAAWRALPVRPQPPYRPPPAQPLYSLAQLVSEQWAGAPPDERARAQNATGTGGNTSPSATGTNTPSAGPAPAGVLLRWVAVRQSLCVAGPAPVIRYWDAGSELLQLDISTDTDAPVTELWRSEGGEDYLTAAGFGDGGVRVWDERAPSSPILHIHEHHAPVLTAARRADLYTHVTACADGYVRLYDTRRMGTGCAPAAEFRAQPPLAAVDVHPLASLLACGSVNQCIGLWDLRGNALNTIKFHEGFMGARIGPVSCLAFHPLKVAMGVGSKDSTVSVYAGEARR